MQTQDRATQTVSTHNPSGTFYLGILLAILTTAEEAGKRHHFPWPPPIQLGPVAEDKGSLRKAN